MVCMVGILTHPQIGSNSHQPCEFSLPHWSLQMSVFLFSIMCRYTLCHDATKGFNTWFSLDFEFLPTSGLVTPPDPIIHYESISYNSCDSPAPNLTPTWSFGTLSSPAWCAPTRASDPHSHTLWRCRCGEGSQANSCHRPRSPRTQPAQQKKSPVDPPAMAIFIGETDEKMVETLWVDPPATPLPLSRDQSWGIALQRSSKTL